MLLLHFYSEVWHPHLPTNNSKIKVLIMFYFSCVYFYYQTVIKFIIFMPYKGYHKFSINNCWFTSLQ